LLAQSVVGNHYCNRTLIVKVIVENVVTFLWDTMYNNTVYKKFIQKQRHTSIARCCRR